MNLNGILAPVVTPFSASGDIDQEDFQSNIAAHIGAGACGIVVTGSTGEAALLDDAERAALVSWARKEVPSDLALLAGTGSESTRATIERSRIASELGADGVLVVAPHYYSDRMSPVAIQEHYLRVADASPVPVLLYTIPKYMHFSVPPDVVAALAKHENIVGMKDSAGDAALFSRYLESQSDSFKVLTGSGVLWAEALRLGAHGGILAASLFAPALCFDVWAASQRGDHESAARVQTILAPLAARIIGAMGVPGVKAALDLVGLAGGAPRSPLRPLDAAGVGEVGELLRTAELAPTA